jgi:hypothetical protein
VDDEYRPWAGHSGLVIGIPPWLSPDEYERSASAQVQPDSLPANVMRGLVRFARHRHYATMGEIPPFFSTTVAPLLAVLGAAENPKETAARTG